MKQKILDLLKAGPLTEQGLMGRLKMRKQKQRRHLQELLREMVSRGQIELVGDGSYHLIHGPLLEGEVLSLHHWFGFVRTEKGEDLYVAWRHMQDALPGDRVQLRILKGRQGRPAGVVRAVLQRAQRPLTGVLDLSNGLFVPEGSIRFPLPIVGVLPPANEGDRVVAMPFPCEDFEEGIGARILAVTGSGQSAAACVAAWLIANNVPTEFPPEVLAEAEEAANRPLDITGRLDLRHEPVFTIDSADAKDLDDAVSISRQADGYRLWVHIADVSSYVPLDSSLDREALSRGTSVYFANQVLPMLPPALSNGVCSLSGNEERLAMSCCMELSLAGELLSWQFYNSVIRSAVRGVYSEINDLLAGQATPDIEEKYAPVLPQLPLLLELSTLLRERRLSEGAVELQTVEYKITVDQSGLAAKIEERTQGDSQRIIEECMLLCNRAAAGELTRRHRPCLYRVHQYPTQERAEAFYQVLDALGVQFLRPKGRLTQKRLCGILKTVAGTPLAVPVNLMALRVMQKAYYSPENIGHYGLAFPTYAHFTSPIRRYPDLFVHRVLKATLLGKPTVLFTKRAGDVALSSSQRELLAATAERDCGGYYIAEVLSSHVGETVFGMVSAALPQGLYVRLSCGGEGLLSAAHLEKLGFLPDGPVAYRAKKQRLMIGDMVQVSLATVSIPLCRIDLTLCEITS